MDRSRAQADGRVALRDDPTMEARIHDVLEVLMRAYRRDAGVPVEAG